MEGEEGRGGVECAQAIVSVGHARLCWAVQVVYERQGALYALIWICLCDKLQHAQGRGVTREELRECAQGRCELEVRGGESERCECGEVVFFEQSVEVE